MVRAAFVEPNPAVFKGVLHAQGRIATPDVRMPLDERVAAARSTAASMRSSTRRA